MLFFEIAGVDPMFFQEIIKIRPVLPGEARGAADNPIGKLEEVNKIAFFKGVFGLLERLDCFSRWIGDRFGD